MGAPEVVPNAAQSDLKSSNSGSKYSSPVINGILLGDNLPATHPITDQNESSGFIFGISAEIIVSGILHSSMYTPDFGALPVIAINKSR